MSASEVTQDHQKIKNWITQHGGKPAVVEGTQGDGAGVLRVKFDDNQDDLAELDWQDFFATFDESNLAFLYQSEPKNSRFFKFVQQ